jgi:hypothetical protein
MNLIVAVALATAGITGFVYLLSHDSDWRGWMLLGTGLVAFLGLYWLWASYIHKDQILEE